MQVGTVFLVGAGPGDIGLITVRGLEVIKQAEVILYDRLANPKLLEYAPDECERIYCGKLPDRHILRQEKINELLVSKALEGKRVVRLKGGDPGVFGRVGEEAAALADCQIPFEIVPGITSGMAAPLYAGIPVTHRTYAESFAVVTAHDKSVDGKPVLDWESLARGIDTIAFYMGVRNLPFICENLIKYGKSADTPVILIQWGTFGRQKTLTGSLEDISEKVIKAHFSNPSIILVGKVVSLREKISWFEKKPLYGQQILLARTGNSNSELAKGLMKRGADVIEFPKWKKTMQPVDQELITKLSSYEKILFASPESIHEFFTAIFQHGWDIRQVRAQFYGNSVKTVRALHDRGLTANLAEQMPESGTLLMVGDSRLQNREGPFDCWITSKKGIDHSVDPLFLRMLEEAEVNTVIFPCQAAIEPFMDGLAAVGMDAAAFLSGIRLVCMGRQTWNAAKAAGLSPTGMPEKATRDALIEYLQTEVSDPAASLTEEDKSDLR